MDKPPFDDLRVRRAVQLAVDVGVVLDAVYYGLAKRATGIVPQGILGYRGYNLYPERDVAEAKRLLAEAGFPNGFKTTLSCLSDTDKVTMAQVIQSNLADVGIDAEIAQFESGAFWTLGMESTARRGRTSRSSSTAGEPAPTPTRRFDGTRPARSGSGTGSGSGTRSSTRSAT